MEIYQLKVFLEVARHLSFTEAADTLNLTQPAVSAKIKSLEESLGVELFHRLGRKIKLTRVGDYLFNSGPELIALESRLVKEVNEIKEGKHSRLTIGCTASVSDDWIPNVLFQSRQKYPKVELSCLSFASVKSLHQSIMDGEVDIGISETSLHEFDEIESQPIDRFHYCLMVATDHRLANCQWLSLKDLTSEVWAFPPTGTPERLVLESRLSELGMKLSDFTHHEIVQTQSLMCAFLRQGHYLGFTSSFQFQSERQAKALVSIPLQEFSLESRLFLLISKKISRVMDENHQKRSSKYGATEPLQQFIHLLKQYSQQKLKIHVPSSRDKVSARSPSIVSEKAVPETVIAKATSSTKESRGVYFRSPTLSTRKSNSTDSEILTIKIGIQNKTIQTVTAGLIIEKLNLLEHFLPRNGQYRNTKYRIKWIDFTSGAPIVKGLQSQQLDIGILGDYPLLLSGTSHSDASSPVANTRLVSFVASNPDGSGNTIIVPSHSKLSSLDDLRNRIIAVPFASAAHGMMMRTLAKENLLQEVTLASIDKLNIHQLTPRNNQADGYAYFAPLHEIASSHGQFRRLIDDQDVTMLPTFHGIVVEATLADNHPNIVVAYLKALIAAQHWYITTPNALSLVSNWTRLDPEIIAKTLEYSNLDTTGLFFPETTIRSDWITEHIHQLKTIPGNQKLGEINTTSWIQSEFLETALSSI
ncbi:MAG: LysR substrate-binding domain-containing protein [Cyanobacteria bacterium P01_E01_bin.6]